MNDIHNYKVAIIGAGILGLATAYELSKRINGEDIIIFDQSSAGHGATRASGGMLGAQNEFTEDTSYFKAAIQSREMYPAWVEELSAQTGLTIDIHHNGLTKIASTTHEENLLLEQYNFLKQSDITVKTIDCLEAPNAMRAIHIPKDGAVNVHQLTDALLKAIELNGVTLKEHTKVEQIDQLTVYTEDASYDVDHITLTVGSYGKTLLKNYDMDQFDTVFGESVLISHPTLNLDKTLFHQDGTYVVPKGNETYLIGATSVLDDTTFNSQRVQTLLDQAVSHYPRLKGYSIIEYQSGHRSKRHGDDPFYNLIPGANHISCAIGHYRNGILLAPYTGKTLSEIILKDLEGIS